MISWRLLIAAAGILVVCGSAPGQKPDRSAPPPPGPLPELHLPAVQHATLSGGIPVVLLEKHNLPLVQIEVAVKGGVAEDPPGKAGVASLTATMMQEGAGGRDALAFADAVDFLGATLTAYAGWHTSGASLHTVSAHLDSGLVLLRDMVLSPRFPEEELGRKRTELLTSIAQWHDDPSAIASVLFHVTVFGPDHPYGRPTTGMESSIRAITTADLRSFHDSWFQPGNATILVVGDIRMDDILPKLERLFSGWAPGKVAPRVPYPAPHRRPTAIYLVDKPGAAQSEIMAGSIGIERKSPDYFAVQVMNDILGGSFTSRLNQDLRETHGYTYGASSSFEARLSPGPFVVRTAVQTAVTAPALAALLLELRAIRDPVTPDELSRAENYLTLRYPQNFQSVDGITSRLSELVTYGLPDDYFNLYADRIRSVGGENVRAAAMRCVVPDSLTIVIVGDRSLIESGLDSLHLAPIHILSVDEVLGPVPKTGRDD